MRYPLPILVVHWGGYVHLLHSLFYVPSGVYSTSRLFFACIGVLPTQGLLEAMKVLAEAFEIWHAVRTLTRADHVSHFGGVILLDW